MATPAESRVGDEVTPLLGSEQAEEDAKTTATGWSLRSIGIASILAVLIFIQGASISGLTTITGAIATDLHALSKASWLISSFVIAGSSTQPLFGRLCKIFSPRTCLFVSSMFFTVGLVVTGLAPSFAVFCVGRVLSGIGSGGIISCTLIIILGLVSEEKRGLGVGLVNAGFTMGVSLGAVIYGACIEVTGWRELFLAQAPLPLIAGIAALFVFPKTENAGDEKEPILHLLAKIDYLGMITLTTAILLFLIPLASTQVAIIPLLLSFPCAGLFLLIEAKYTADPIIPVSVLRSRGALLSCLATTVIMISRWSVLFYSPVYALAIREWAPSLAGTMLIPANLGFAIGSILVGWLFIRTARSYYLSTVLSTILFVLTIFTLSQILSPTLPASLFMATIFLNGLFTGAILNFGFVHALHLSVAGNQFIVSSLMATFRGLGASFGSSIGGGIFARALQASYLAQREARNLPPDQDLLNQLLGSPEIVEKLTGVEHEIALKSYLDGTSRLFLVMGLIALGAVALQAGTGRMAPKKEAESEDV